MNVKQRLLKLLYPLTMQAGKWGVNNKQDKNNQNIEPLSSIYNLHIQLNNGSNISLSQYKGKKLFLVNTASQCGYTPQYQQLQELYERFKPGLEIIGFPANDFKEQEKGTDEEIASFCKINYGVSFPLAKKSSVVKGPGQNEVFSWLTHSNANGWNNTDPSWNFCKFLINEQGKLVHYFEAGVSPVSAEIVQAITQK